MKTCLTPLFGLALLTSLCLLPFASDASGFPVPTPQATQPQEPVTNPSKQQTEGPETSEGAQSSEAESTIENRPARPVIPNKATNGIFDLTFDDLKFEMEKEDTFDRSMLTDTINGYHGEKVRLRGFIRPSFSQSGLTKFVFVRDNKECCFGPGAAIYDCVLVRLVKGKATDFTVRPVTIEGKFSLKEYKGPDGKIWSIYRMTDTQVK